MSDGIVLPRHPLFKNHIGKRFGRLLVLSYAGRIGKAAISAWRCRCDCGTEIVIAATCLQVGTQSCGCLHREVTGDSHRTHGLSKSPTYGVWSNMIGRCHKTTDKSFRYYGARGIIVCEAWRRSFEAFVTDMGERPSDDHELDRINVNGNYEPGNVRWTSRVVNARNKRTNHVVQFGGETLCISEWAERTGIPRYVIHKRLKVGWPVDQALTLPVGQHGSRWHRTRDSS